MLIFSGIDTDGSTKIYDYLIGTIDPDINTEYIYQIEHDSLSLVESI